VLGALDMVRRPFRSLDYERSLARAWVSASQGAVNEAIAILQAAAETAAANGRFGAEVICLQNAAQLGARTVADRLRELETLVDGPRVGLAARLASAMHNDDPAELDSLSTEFESMGDRVAAVDAAAHAAMAYRRRELRGSALRLITQADELAAQCGGADTPALRQAREPLPLTDREREIVMLVGGGQSNRDIATRLSVSVRTVEGHIYKAMNKTGTESREELAALLPKRMPPTDTGL
jgi:DNA-binding CsgD family transcriptional regulator